MATATETKAPARPIYEIAAEIKKDFIAQKGAAWREKFYAAKPYLEAMQSLTVIEDAYVHDSGKMTVLYFLSNAASWRGEVAKRIKAELKAMAK